jgi:hypothetical protein
MSKNHLKLTLIISLSCCIQLSFMFFIIDPHSLEWPDSNEYISIANTIAHGDSYSANLHNLFRSPGYPFFLAAIISLIGNNLIIIRLIHILLQIFFLIGVYHLGKQWKGERFGLFLTFISSLYPYYIYIPLALVPESLLIFTSPWIIYFFLRLESSVNFNNLLFSSLIISLGTITRPTYIIIAMTFFSYFAFIKTSWIKKLNVFIYLLLIPLFILSLWGYRNLRIHDHFIISTAANANLFVSFNDNTTIYTKIDCPVPDNIQKKLSLAKDDFMKDSIYKNEAINFIKKHPFKSTYLAFVRMLDLWNPIPHTTLNYSLFKKILSSLPYIIVLFFSFFGLYLVRKERFIYVLITILIFNTAINGIFAVSIRYRVIFDIIIIMVFTYFVYTKSPIFYIFIKKHINKLNEKLYLFFIKFFKLKN